MENERKLIALGWRVYTVWECKTRDGEGMLEALKSFLLQDE